MFTVRAATHDDIPTVWAFVKKKAAFDDWSDRLKANPRTLADAMFADPPVLGVLLAEQHGQAVGFATYFFTFSTYLARRCVWLDDLYVDEGVRGQGAGTDLLRSLAKIAIEQGCPRIEWTTAKTNSKAISFYEQIGAKVRHSSRMCRMDQAAITRFAGDSFNDSVR